MQTAFHLVYAYTFARAVLFAHVMVVYVYVQSSALSPP